MARATSFKPTDNFFADVQTPAERKWSNKNLRAAARAARKGGKKGGKGKGGGS